jgi:hypothetical protein
MVATGWMETKKRVAGQSGGVEAALAGLPGSATCLGQERWTLLRVESPRAPANTAERSTTIAVNRQSLSPRARPP